MPTNKDDGSPPSGHSYALRSFYLTVPAYAMRYTCGTTLVNIGSPWAGASASTETTPESGDRFPLHRQTVFLVNHVTL